MSGTTTTDKKPLNASDICRIIKACKESGITTLKFGDLELEFHSQGHADAINPAQGHDWTQEQTTVAPPTVNAPVDERANLVDQDALEEIEAQAIIEDPSAYEEAQLARGLEQSRVDDNDQVQH